MAAMPSSSLYGILEHVGEDGDDGPGDVGDGVGREGEEVREAVDAADEALGVGQRACRGAGVPASRSDRTAMGPSRGRSASSLATRPPRLCATMSTTSEPAPASAAIRSRSRALARGPFEMVWWS